jgi:prepilin-type N-terminal cleavage/methylation domain-containing protein
MLKALKKKREQEEGFTLVELLIVIVIIGILAAVVVLAVGGITDSGSTSACTASKDSATAASVAYYAGSGTGTGNQTTWPNSFAAIAPYMKAQDGVTPNPITGTVLTGKGWTLTMAGGGTSEPTFTCANT